MSPKYIYELANFADPNEIWRKSGIDRRKLSEEEKRQVDSGVALRRHAAHVERLGEILAMNKSLLITPISSNGIKTLIVNIPFEHIKK